VKEAQLTSFDKMEFCSKWVFDTPEGLVLTRDFLKALATKQIYNKTNALIFHDPDLHAVAIWHSIRADEASKLAEDIISARIKDPAKWEKYLDKI